MIKGFPKLYKVTLRLFTYHLQKGSSTNYERIHISRSDIQSYYDVLLKEYHASDSQGVPLQIQWRSDEPKSPFDLLDIAATNGRHIQNFILAWQPPFKGFFYPQLFDDSYIGSFTFYLPDLSGKDGLSVAELKALKPSIHFFSGTTVSVNDDLEQQKLCQILRTAFLGKTLILSAQLREDPEDSTQFAQMCLLSLLGLSSLPEALPLRNRWRFFNGYVYEFCSPEQDSYYGKIWLFLTFRENSITRLDKSQFEWSELFLYDYKNFGNYQDSQAEYQEGLNNIEKIEAIIQQFPSNISDDKRLDLSPEQLNQLKGNLKRLLDISLSYSQTLRSLANFHNTIDIHRQNYEQKIIYIENITDSNLTATLKFADRNFRQYQKQITANLTYLGEGSRLLDTAIATIRGLVEIEQAEGDRILQDEIQAIGVGITAGAIVASTSGLMLEPWELPNPQKPDQLPHPFLIALLVSCICSVGAWKIAQKRIKHRRNIKSN
ncbi:hypothetical protein [Roseofilum capinflatum]|uniref:Uncharacterized protein n=1 Tax=Roseofilum capinflatum BLCC-M114 TaxID=3022440 RepID=A0ABT7BA32_9CYAN|nr:hypothetical protein [Roseofilum capinflatum]MDJ1176025.1 hypothetical protein [Roseofilum capinflatum BLCC-M114]